MSATHAHNKRFPASVDPTRTTGLRNKFEGELARRARRIKGLIRKTVGYENDALGLSTNADPVDVFDFPTNPAKEAAFTRWLKNALDEELLEQSGLLGVRNGNHYTATFVRSAYSRAIKAATADLRAAGIEIEEDTISTIFNLPVHEASLQRLYTRTYENLEDISSDTADVIRRELTEGFAEGVNPRVMASRMNKQIDTITNTRLRTLARTETIWNYNTGILDRYESMNVGRVTIRAEWSTSGDNRVCPICQALEGNTWTISEARNDTITLESGDVSQFLPEGRSASSFTGEFPVRPPSHPSCRCRLLADFT